MLPNISDDMSLSCNPKKVHHSFIDFDLIKIYDVGTVRTNKQKNKQTDYGQNKGAVSLHS